MFFEQKFVLYYDNGKVLEVTDLYKYARSVGATQFYMSMKFSTKIKKTQMFRYESIDYMNYYEHECGFFLYTASGVMISPELFKGEFTKKYWDDVDARWGNWRWRRRRSHNGRRYKRPQTHQERTWGCAVQKDEGEPEIRGSRKPSSLRTYWDDVNSRYSCSWKDQSKRKRQYKGN